MINRRDMFGLGALFVGKHLGLGSRLRSSGQWSQGDADASISGDSGTLSVYASGDFNVVAHHVRMGTYDGNYEFEHSKLVTETHLNSYYEGTPIRTPISVGGDDGQDVLSFIVRGKLGQKHDLQQWAPGGKVKAAIDGNGHLRLGEATLTLEVSGETVELVAHLAGGKRVVLAHGRA